jgi:Fe-S cluster assembly protein SufD
MSWRFSNLKGITLDGFERPEPPASRVVPHGPDFPTHRPSSTATARSSAVAALRRHRRRPRQSSSPLRRTRCARHGDLVRAYLQKHPAGSAATSSLPSTPPLPHPARCSTCPRASRPRSALRGPAHDHCGDGTSPPSRTRSSSSRTRPGRLWSSFFSRPTRGRIRPSGRERPPRRRRRAPHLCRCTELVAGHPRLPIQLHRRPAATPAFSRSTSTWAAARPVTSPIPAWLAPGAHSEMLALTVAHGITRSSTSARSRPTRRPHTSSNLLYKNVLIDHGPTIFSGLIVVEPDAQKTDAYQSNRNLMLSDDRRGEQPPRPRDPGQRRSLHPRRHHQSRIDPSRNSTSRSRGITPHKRPTSCSSSASSRRSSTRLEDEKLHTVLTRPDPGQVQAMSISEQERMVLINSVRPTSSLFPRP